MLPGPADTKGGHIRTPTAPSQTCQATYVRAALRTLSRARLAWWMCLRDCRALVRAPSQEAPSLRSRSLKTSLSRLRSSTRRLRARVRVRACMQSMAEQVHGSRVLDVGCAQPVLCQGVGHQSSSVSAAHAVPVMWATRWTAAEAALPGGRGPCTLMGMLRRYICKWQSRALWPAAAEYIHICRSQTDSWLLLARLVSQALGLQVQKSHVSHI